MALVSVAHSLTPIEQLTRNALLKRFLRETGLGDYGTATGGSTTTIIDTTKLQSTQFNTREWVGGWGRISKDAGGAGAAPEGSISPITTYAPSTGTITLNPAITAVAASDEYELWRVNPSTVLDLLDQILKEDVFLPCWTMLSELPDYDMEASTYADWTASNTTLSKSTTDPVIAGKRHLSVVTTSALGYARSALVTVEPGKTYHVSALVRCSAASTTARLLAYDETNAATIDSRDSVRRYPVRLGFEFTIPTDCYQMSIRLANVENTVTTLWDEVVLFAQESTSIALPWWVKSKDQVKGVFRYLPHSIATDLNQPEFHGEQDKQWDIQDNPFSRGQLRLQARYGSIAQPLFIFGLRNETAFANDNSDGKLVDQNYLLACLGYRVFHMLSQQPNSGLVDMKWMQGQLIYYNDLWKKEQYRQMERLEQVITSPSPLVNIQDRRFQYLS